MRHLHVPTHLGSLAVATGLVAAGVIAAPPLGSAQDNQVAAPLPPPGLLTPVSALRQEITLPWDPRASRVPVGATQVGNYFVINAPDQQQAVSVDEVRKALRNDLADRAARLRKTADLKELGL